MRFLFWLAALAGIAGIFAFAFFTSAIERPGPLSETRPFVVERGATGNSIAVQLERDGYINDALLFRIANRLYASDATLQAGEYEIPARASVRQIVGMMSSGAALQHAITFPEGITIAGVMRILEESDVLTGDMPEAPAEGSILPDTYHVQRGMTRAALLQHVTRGDYVTPSCPKCEVKMTRRAGRAGRSDFWSCPNFGACRTRPIAVRGTA